MQIFIIVQIANSNTNNKNSNRMRKRSRDFDGSSQTTRRNKNRINHSIKGLTTSRQHYIDQYDKHQAISNNTQGTQYTHLTGKTRSFRESQDLQLNYQQLEKQQNNQIFINKEQERLIQTVLQIARKGKINQKNAFEIPLKLANEDILNPSLNKFWKFASELLGASVCIYDKRIENIWVDTNKIHDKLVRINLETKNRGKNQEDDDDLGEKTSSKLNNNMDPLILPIQQFRKASLLDSIKLGQCTLEDPQKLNLKKLDKNYNRDPLFGKKLMTFDNSSNSSLLLNVFELGPNQQIQMFTSIAPIQDINLYENIDLELFKYVEQNVYESKEKKDKACINEAIYRFRKNNFKEVDKDVEFGIEAKNEEKENVLNDAQIQNYFQGEFQKYLTLPQWSNQQHVAALNQIHQHHNFSAQHPQSLDPKFEHSLINSQPENYNRQNMDDYNSDLNTMNEYYSMSSPFNEDILSMKSAITPWEMQFKDGKLQKKKGQRRNNKPGNRKKKQKIQAGQIEFDALVIEKRAKVLNCDKNPSKSRSKKKSHKNNNDNLMPAQMFVYEKYNYSKIKDYTASHQAKHPQQEDINQLASFLGPDPSMLRQEHLQNIQQTNQQPVGILDTQNFFSPQRLLSIQNPHIDLKNTYRQLNIRQLKKSVFDEVSTERQLRLSQVEIDTDPSNILLAFLHIANEKNLVVRDIEDESDVLLTWE